MKHLLFLFTLVFFSQFLSAQYCGNSGPAQCAPSGTQTVPGLFPETMNLPSLVNGQQSQVVLNFLNFDTVRAFGNLLTVHTLKIDSINNLPAGLCWATNRSDNTYCNGLNNPAVTDCPVGMPGEGCIRISGTTCAAPGIYRLKIKVLVDLGLGFAVPYDGDNVGLIYYLRVRNASENEVMLDTSQTAPFVPYGYAADCALQPIAVTLGANQTVCGGSVITLSPNIVGGQTPYTFAWSGSGNALSCNNCQNPSATITQASSYTVTVTDAASQTATASISYSLSGGTNQMQLSFNSTGISCANPVDNTTLTVTNGSSPFIFSWGDGGSSTSGNSPQQHNYTHSGSFVVTVADASGCTTSALHTVANTGVQLQVSSFTQPNCFGLSTGKIKVTATGGTAPYSYIWSNTAITDSVVNVAAGNYRVTVTDAASCSASLNFLLSPAAGWGYYVYMQPSGSNCNNTGSIVSTVYNGNAPYTYLWSNGGTTASINNLAGGIYNVTVSDALGCTTTGATQVGSSCYSIISGVAFTDSNNNCLLNIGEDGVYGINVRAVSGTGQTFYGYTNANGNYAIQLSAPGTYTLTAFSNSYASCGNLTLCNNGTQTVTIATLGDTSANNNFGFTGSTGFNLGLGFSYTSGNPGFTKTYHIMSHNQSFTAFTGVATVDFVYDTALIYQSSNLPVVHNPLTHTLSWAIDSIDNYWWSWNDVISVNFLVPLNVSMGQLVTSHFSITPTLGDCDSSDNYITITDDITGSFDPNEKKVQPAGGVFEEDSVLTYTIGFQNTGTDSTHFIILKDTLSPHLDPSTVRNIASSHPYSEFTISGSGILTWTFNPLRLVDSFTNEPGSHGFVMFTIKKKKNLPIGTIISNKASIYFDYNAPVVTNTVTNTIADPNFIFELRSNAAVSVKAFPNPFSSSTTILVEGIQSKFDFELYDVTGRLRRKISSIENNQFSISKNELSSGVYFFKIVTGGNNRSGHGKLVVE